MKNTTYIIENGFIKKTLNIVSDKIVSWDIHNKLSGNTVSSLQGSEEFIIFFKGGLFCNKIKCSELKVESIDCADTVTGKRHTIIYKSVRVRDSYLTVKLVYDAPTDRKILKKHIELSMDKRGDKTLILDYIDFERLHFDGNLKCWSIPKQANSHIPGYALEMGQPLYIDSIFMGCEFPACLNKIQENTTTLRYYSGKKISDVLKNNLFVSYDFVVGAAEGNIFEQVQKAFFEYIRSISKPCRLRRQYNSWYDHMLNITRENVYGSFLEIDKALTKTGEKPLDSFVADDGWNDYSKGFWTFNDKFPDELYPFSSLAENLGSNFGLWVGPRGGYTTDTIKFARHIQDAGNGYVNKNSMDICVASEKYVNNMTDMMLDFQRRFNLNYWKLDGFAQAPCTNKKHDHMTGGTRNMYFYTDVWEKWLSVFEKLGDKGSNNFWINLTCYAPPSAWFLKYVNSLWMQTSLDVGFVGKKGSASDKDRMLSYRDERYMDFYKNRQYQFPQRCLYNHDPIYGNEAKVSMNDDEFREYLFTMAMRGTAFWELYYSYNMMNDAKWRINYSTLRFIEENIDVLSNSIIFGGNPAKGQVYGYSCFGEHEGIVCLRNSASGNAEYTIRLDETIGVSKGLLYAPMTVILPYKGDSLGDAYSYGDKIKVSLAPYQTKILHFGRKKKDMAADYVTVTGKNTAEVTFNQFINCEHISCKENPVKNVKLCEDYMSAVITFENDFQRINNIKLTDVRDIMGNSFDAEVSFDWYENNIVTEGVYGKGAFAIKATLDGEQAQELMHQGEEISLRVAQDGYVHFKVGSVNLKSRSTVQDKVQVMALREKNGVLKIYLDAVLDSGIYGGLYELSGEKAVVYNEGKVQIYNKSFAYDEV